VQVLVLCGGRGTRAYPLTVELPKPLLPVAGRPVLGHLLDVYARQGVVDVVLAAGFGVDAVREFAGTLPRALHVTVVDTGLDTGTGARIAACLDLLDDTFHATYGDGLADVDLGGLVARHREHGRGATVTTVPLLSQYGTLDLDATDAVLGFNEKPVLHDHWINAGFFVFDRKVLQCYPGEDLERDVLPAMASAGSLAAYRHGGFWRSLDTYKDQQELDLLASEGAPPWST
jgi:glucose-1-phosphate cytidylyltransferase